MTNLEEVKVRVKGLDDKTAKAVVCALVGHSSIVTTCFGYVYCARCGAQTGDSLGGASTTKDNVVVGHNCETCRANFEKLDWRSKFMCDDPFEVQPAGETA